MARLGQHLIRQGLITAEQLDEALQHQALYGARLGTNLVDLAMISMSELAQQLSTFHKAPLPPREWVTKPHRAAVKICNRGLVERLRFVPMRLEGKTLHAAVLDPNDPSTLDDLRFATGCRVKCYVLPELAMHDLLARLWKVPRGIRPVDVEGAEAKLESSRHSGTEPARSAVATPAAGGAREIDLAGWEHNQPVNSGTPVHVDALDRKLRRARQRAGARQRRNNSKPGSAGGARPAKISASPPPPPAHAISRPPAPPAEAVDASKQVAAVMRGGSRRQRPSTAQAQAVAAPIAAPPAAPAPEPAPAAAPDVEPGLPPLPSPTITGGLPGAEENVGEAAAGAPVTGRTEPPPVSNLAAQLASIVPDPMPEEDALPEPPREPTPVPKASPVPQALDLGALESRLLEAGSRDELIATAMELACAFAPRVALFMVHQGTIQGARCSVLGHDTAIDGVLFPVESESMLAGVAASGGEARVTPGEQPFDKRLLQMLGEGTPEDAGVFAVTIKSRVVNVLYVDQNTGKLPMTSYAACKALVELMAQSYEALILRRKGG